VAPILNDTKNDFFFVRRERESDIPDTIADLVLNRLPRTYGSSIIDQIQIITPSKKGNGGVIALNAVLQNKINPPAKFKREVTSGANVFRVGDKVMQTVNNYDIRWERAGSEGYGIFNGDIGEIDSINSVDDEVLVRFDDRVAYYSHQLLSELEHAYAITVHKSQGSEYPVVVIPMYSCAPMLMSRNLLYTAVTRAKRMVIMVGRSDVPSIMVNNKREVMRYTTLCDRIREA
jgi:exodeoxyribonuclease V alpha subunit